jgi:hypothetical protein
MRQWIRSHMSYANVMVTVLAFIVLGGMSYAATGGKFILGQSNSASSKSTLSAPIADKALTVTNTSPKAGATALGLNVAKGRPPFRVNSGTKVNNLNADQVDGLDGSSGFGLVHLGTAPQTSGNTVIQWNELGARIRSTGSNDNSIRIENSNPSEALHVRYGTNQSTIGVGSNTVVNVTNLTTFIIWTDGTRSWLVACASVVGPATAGTRIVQSQDIRCQGLASRTG